jgi:hypothetical protein
MLHFLLGYLGAIKTFIFFQRKNFFLSTLELHARNSDSTGMTRTPDQDDSVCRKMVLSYQILRNALLKVLLFRVNALSTEILP